MWIRNSRNSTILKNKDLHKKRKLLKFFFWLKFETDGISAMKF